MRKKFILAGLATAILVFTVATAYALTWQTRYVRQYYVGYHKLTCAALTTYNVAGGHRVILDPINNDVDLFIFGIGGDPYTRSWVRIGYSRYNALSDEYVTFTNTTRNAYPALIIACGYGYGGNSYYNLYYQNYM